MSFLLKRAIQWLLALTALLQSWVGLFFLLEHRSDIVSCATGLVLILTSVSILVCVLMDASAVMALLQVFTIVFQMIISILIITSLYFGMQDRLVVAVYFSSLSFFTLQSILLRHLIRICFRELRAHYQDVEGSTF